MQSDIGFLNGTMRRRIEDHWALFLVEGVILLVLGVIAMAFPPLAGLASTLVLGWLLLVAGCVGLAATLVARRAPGFGWSIVSALAALIAGIVLMLNPVGGLVTLTYVLIAFFIIDGVMMIALAQSHRRELADKAGWMTANGVFDLFLAALIIAGLPGTLTWAFGLMVGVDLLFGGSSLIAMALAARNSVGRPPAV
jgi:uncharacterized membrane protein HdeD (DUF308 family)